MKLSRLELLGFKSFLHRTVFTFSEGITAIVGPNGCGKSNVVDAIVWVLGERGMKSLRIKDMEDVIFHGTDGKRPFGLAEVSIEFIDGEKEIAIKRRIFRDGTTEYFINNRPVRLKDILSLFMGTGIGMNGYAIVEQGKLEMFLQMKPHERRVLIEEACGITRFEEKKTQAFARIEEVKLNLERIADLYKEIKGSWEKARVERERWKKYEELTERLTHIETLILKEGLKRIEGKRKKILEELLSIEKEIQTKTEEKESIRRLLDVKKQEFSITDGTLRKMELDTKEREKEEERTIMELEQLKSEQRRCERDVENIKRELIDLEKRQNNTESRIADLELKLKEMEENIKDNETRVRDEEKAVGFAKKKLEELEGFLETKRGKLFVVAGELSELKNKILEIERKSRERQIREERKKEEITKIEKSLVRLTEKNISLFQRAKTLKEELLFLSITLDEMNRKKEEMVGKMKEKETLIRRLEGEIQAKESYLKMLTYGSKSDAGKSNRLIDLMPRGEKKERVFEVMFSKELEYTVSEENDPYDLAKTVRNKGGGLIFFCKYGIFNKVEGRVDIKIKEKKCIEEVFEAISLGEEGIFFSEGYCIDSRGFVHPKEGRDSFLKKHKEIVKTKEEIEELQVQVTREYTALKECKKNMEEYEHFFIQARNKKEKMEMEERQIEKEIMVTQTEIKSMEKRRQDLRKEDPLEFFLDPTVEEEYRKKKDEKEKEKAQIEAEYETLKKDLQKIKKDYDKYSSEWHKDALELEKKRAILESLKDDLERSKDMLEKLNKEMEKGQKELEVLKRRSHEIKSKELEKEEILKRIKKEKGGSDEIIEELTGKIGNLKTEVNLLEDRLKHIDLALELLRRKREELEKERVLIEEKKEVLQERLGGRIDMEKEERAVLSLPKLERERETILRERESLGEINFRAEREFKELDERMRFIEKEKQDLELSLESLKKTISRIESYSKEVFASTFHAINETFKTFVEKLFEGGTGSLRLNDDTKGVELLVQPKGKRIQRMESLSGGEKALVSLSFLLSLMDTKPAPFSILDEIDASLDDSNILRLRELLKEMGKKTQLIIVTHNRLTVEASDFIYGITMEEDGISKIVSAKI